MSPFTETLLKMNNGGVPDAVLGHSKAAWYVCIDDDDVVNFYDVTLWIVL